MNTATAIDDRALLLAVHRSSSAAAAQDGVDAGALELVDLRLRDVAARSAIASLPAGTSESRSSTCWSGSSSSRAAENDELRVEALEAVLELVLVRDADDELDAGSELELVARAPNDAGVRRRARVARGEDRQRARGADRFEVAVGEQTPRRRRPRRAVLPAGPSTATISEMPSPSDMAWLRRLGPVTRGEWYLSARSATVGIVRAAARDPAAPRGGAAGRRGSRRAGAVSARRAPTSSRGTRELRPRRRAGRQRPDRRRVRRRRRPRLVRRRAATSSPPMRATGSTRDCEVVSRRIHRDRHANPESQHESEVEPDSQTVGQTTVAVFQVGRNRSGGAASIGFSTSKDGGRTWREGILPGLTRTRRRRGRRARERPRRRLGRGARRLAREHARDRARCDAADDPPLDGRALVERPDRRGAVANSEPRLRQELADVRQRRRRARSAAAATSRTRWSASARTTSRVQRSDDGGRTWSPR